MRVFSEQCLNNTFNKAPLKSDMLSTWTPPSCDHPSKWEGFGKGGPRLHHFVSSILGFLRTPLFIDCLRPRTKKNPLFTEHSASPPPKWPRSVGPKWVSTLNFEFNRSRFLVNNQFLQRVVLSRINVAMRVQLNYARAEEEAPAPEPHMLAQTLH